MEYSPKKMQENLTDHQFYFKKNYGQNFIIDKNIINKIVQASNIDSDTIVIEVGPGAGSLTLGLAHSAKQVQCYEIDQTLQPILDETFKRSNLFETICYWKFTLLYYNTNYYKNYRRTIASR